MPLTTAEAFEKRHIVRQDGVSVLTRPLITVAAIEAGYCVPTPMVNDAASSTQCPGQMTFEEFLSFCENNRASCVTARDMAKAVVVAAPTGIVTRSGLRDIMAKTSDKPLSEEELDSLFATLDTENKGAFSAEALMRAIYGEEGAVCLNEVRAEEAKKETERIAREKEEERKRQEEKERREREAAKKAEEDRKAREAEAEKKEKAKGCC